MISNNMINISKKPEEIKINNLVYKRLPIKTHLINFGEDLISLLEKYASNEFQRGDWIAISEKVVSVCQNNVRHISTVKASWLAKLIVKGVKKYPNDIGFSRPEKMQLVVELAGTPRIIFAMIIGAIGKIFGIRGIFWSLVGHRAAEIDGFNPDAMFPYTEYAVLPPQNPEKVCEEIEKKLNMPAAIIDGNNINVKIIAQSKGVPVSKKIARLILLDNPMGQDDELTPFIIVRKL
ncbi:MAG: coenzyme F420-0:L-glutamate ligase [Minisyncoccia bacterium]